MLSSGTNLTFANISEVVDTDEHGLTPIEELDVDSFDWDFNAAFPVNGSPIDRRLQYSNNTNFFDFATKNKARDKGVMALKKCPSSGKSCYVSQKNGGQRKGMCVDLLKEENKNCCTGAYKSGHCRDSKNSKGERTTDNRCCISPKCTVPDRVSNLHFFFYDVTSFSDLSYSLAPSLCYTGKWYLRNGQQMHWHCSLF